MLQVPESITLFCKGHPQAGTVDLRALEARGASPAWLQGFVLQGEGPRPEILREELCLFSWNTATPEPAK